MSNWLFGVVLTVSMLGCSSGGRDLAADCTGTQCQPNNPSGPGTPSDECPDGTVLLQGRCQQAPGECPAGEAPGADGCGPVDGLAVELLDRSACMTDNGVTQLLVRFVNRDASGRALGDGAQVSSELRIDGNPLDLESQLDSQSELLQSDLFMSLVLDASYSMLLQQPPAFAPMLEAAEDLTTAASTTWQSNGSNFTWALSWFNEFIYQPETPPEWSIADIGRIPPPEQANYTSLYKAVHQMAGVHWQRYQAGVASDERDQHIMVVLSDGADNYSYFDNSDVNATLNLEGSLRYVQRGEAETTLADLDVTLAQQPNLRVYVIGIGSSVNQTELRAIAAAGNGTYFYDGDPGAVGDLFEQVSDQFVTVQTLGALTPLRPGEYEFSVLSSLSNGESVTSESFTLNTTDLPACSP